MSIKKEPSGRRSVQIGIEIPGTPEEVWHAIVTGSAIPSWFVPTSSPSLRPIGRRSGCSLEWEWEWEWEWE